MSPKLRARGRTYLIFESKAPGKCLVHSRCPINVSELD